MLDTTGRPIFNDAMTADGLPTLKGRPILESNDVSINNIYFVDLNYYWIAVKRGMEVRVSNQATVEVDGTLKSLWQRNLTGVIVEERHDGELVTEGALASLTGIRT
jgi:HK97 family phage major capsid protein